MLAAPEELFYRTEDLNLSKLKTKPKAKSFAAAYVTSQRVPNFLLLHCIYIRMKRQVNNLQSARERKFADSGHARALLRRSYSC